MNNLVSARPLDRDEPRAPWLCHIRHRNQAKPIGRDSTSTRQLRRRKRVHSPAIEVPRNLPWRLSMTSLVELYTRLRDEYDEGRDGMNPNDPTRAIIAMAVLEAGEDSEANSANIERIARRLLRSRHDAE